MNKSLAGPNGSIPAQPVHELVPRQLIVTTSVVILAIRDWSLWVLLRDSPWGPPMRLVLGTESVTDAVDRTLDALLVIVGGQRGFHLVFLGVVNTEQVALRLYDADDDLFSCPSLVTIAFQPRKLVGVIAARWCSPLSCDSPRCSRNGAASGKHHKLGK